MQNSNGIAHSAAMAGMSDVIPFMVLLAYDMRPAFTIKFETEILSEVPVDEELICEVKIHKINKLNSFVDFLVYKPSDNELLVKTTLAAGFLDDKPRLWLNFQKSIQMKNSSLSLDFSWYNDDIII